MYRAHGGSRVVVVSLVVLQGRERVGVLPRGYTGEVGRDGGEARWVVRLGSITEYDDRVVGDAIS